MTPAELTARGVRVKYIYAPDCDECGDTGWVYFSCGTPWRCKCQRKSRAPSPQERTMTDAPKRIWEFDRYINGVLMAEGVTVEKQPDIASAMKAAAIIASRGPHGEVPVLIVREGASEHAALIREAEARGMERAMPSDQAIQDLADHIWRVHPNEIAEAGYAHVSHGGKYENPRAAWYADQIKALCRAALATQEAGT